MNRTAFFFAAVAVAAVATSTLHAAKAQGAAGYQQCVVLKTDFVNKTEQVTTDKGKLGLIPPGWTPIGGTAVPKGVQYVGAVVLCR